MDNTYPFVCQDAGFSRDTFICCITKTVCERFQRDEARGEIYVLEWKDRHGAATRTKADLSYQHGAQPVMTTRQHGIVMAAWHPAWHEDAHTMSFRHGARHQLWLL